MLRIPEAKLNEDELILGECSANANESSFVSMGSPRTGNIEDR